VNVLLICPDMGGIYSAASVFMPPLGLLYIATVLKRAGHDISFCDVAVDGAPRDMDSADVVGITCTTPQYPAAIEYARQAKELGKIVLMGGPHVSFTVDETLRTGWVDYVIRNEGEVTALHLLQAIGETSGRFDRSKILGISWLDEDTKEVRNNPPRPFVDDIDDLPIPDRSLMNVEAYKATKLEKTHPATTMVTSRGCPYDCSFCLTTRFTGHKWRMGSAARVVDEMEEIVTTYGFEGIYLNDDNFAVSTKRVDDICNEIFRRKLKFRWWGMCRADTVCRNEALVEKMARSGCGTVFLGLETPDDRVLKAYNKASVADVGRRAVAVLKRHGIRAHGAFILGGPLETAADSERTIRYAMKLNPKIVQFTLLTPFPGSRTYEELEDRLITKDWSLYDGTHVVYESDHATVAERQDLYKKSYSRYYFRPRYVLEHWRTVDVRKTLSLVRSLKSLRPPA